MEKGNIPGVAEGVGLAAAIRIRERKMKKNALRASLASLAVTSLLAGALGGIAGAAVDPAADDAAMRKADSDWAAAGRAANVDAWMSFYAGDAIVLLPNEPLASGREPVRHAVTRLLARPHLSIAWRPVEVNVARSGDLAFLIEAYDLRYDDAHGARVSDRGRRLATWRKQTDGGWKCILDTWNLDEPAAPSSAVSPAVAQGTAPPAAPLSQTPPPPAAPKPGTPAPARAAASKYGEMPVEYEQAIRQYFQEHLKYPESVQYGEITTPREGYTTKVTGGFLMSEQREYGWTVKATVNAKESEDGYVGPRTYTFLFRGEEIIDVRLPLPGMR